MKGEGEKWKRRKRSGRGGREAEEEEEKWKRRERSGRGGREVGEKGEKRKRRKRSGRGGREVKEEGGSGRGGREVGEEEEKRKRRERGGREHKGREYESYLIKRRRQFQVNELEEQGPKRFDLAATGHADTAGAKQSHPTKVGTREREDSKEELFLGPAQGEIHTANTLIPSDIQWNLFIMDTLGPAISGSFLLLYRGFPLSEVKTY